MTESGFLLLKSRILEMLGTGLDPRLTYHNPGHTEDVLFQAERIALAEKVYDTRSVLLIRVAALFHDTGFLHTYREHEEKSCVIMREMLNDGSFDEQELNIIAGMIRATKTPQQPSGLVEMILCDADLDYLGRKDFPVIADTLKEELLAFDFIKSEEEWNRVQIDFLEKHHYLTATSLQDRAPVKQQYLEELKRQLVMKKYNEE